MSNSSLVNHIRISPNKTSPRNARIDRITIHHMAGNLSVETCGNVFAPTSRKASSNYGIGSDGRVGMYVEEKDRSWCSSSAANDNRAVTIEVADDRSTGGWHSSEKAMNKLIQLCADICKRNGISRLNYTGNTSGNLTMHKWFAATDCPGAYLEQHFPWIATQTNNLLTTGKFQGISGNSISGIPYGSGGASGNGDNAYNAAMGGISRDQVNWDYLKYMLATIDRRSGASVNFETLKKNNNFAGVIIEAGYLFNSSHVKQYYRNPYIHEQCIAATKANVPFGLYCDCKARSIEEAKEELYQLSFCIRKYPPVLGMWVHFQLTKTTAINDSIIEYYRDFLVLLGLKGAIGIIATDAELKTFSWKTKHEKDWELWLNRHISSVSQIETLLDPDFFSV